MQRSRSTGHRPESAPVVPPLIIHNRIDNYYEDERPTLEDRYQLRTPVLYSPAKSSHSRSRSRHDSRRSSSNYSRDAWELERVRKELGKYKLEEQREAEEKRIKEELEYKRLREEKKAEEEKARLKKEHEKAVQEYKEKEAARIAKEKKEKEEREKEYKKRLEEDLRKAGLDEGRIAVVLKKDKMNEPGGRPTYTRMSRRHLSIETLNKFKIDYELDQVCKMTPVQREHANVWQDANYVLIKRWVPEWEQDFLWNHTRVLREKKVLMIEQPRHHHVREEREILLLEQPHHHRGRERLIEYDKKEHKRKASPSALLSFFAGGK